MALARGHMAVNASLEAVVAGEAAAGQHDAAARMHQHASVLPRNERARNVALLGVELHDGRGQPEWNIAL